MSTRNVLVPYDFTTAAVTAAQYAIDIAKTLGAEVNLLHITKDSKENKKATVKFEKILSELNLLMGDPKVNTIVKKGDIFEDIASVGKELHSSIIIMGTHGAKGMQKVFGSFAIKVITSTHIPFIIVQDGNKFTSTKDIIFPIDYTKESLQIEQVISAIAGQAKSKVHLLSEKYSDTTYKIKSAVHHEVVTKQFNEKAIEYHKAYINDFAAKDIVKYAKKNNCDLIGISYYSDSLFSQFDRIFQDVITNEAKIPALIINSKDVGNYFF
jgi:nucleotide-binding universal stress UspA family protein